MSRQKQPFSQRLKNAVLVILFLPAVLPLAAVAIVLFLLYEAALYLLVWTCWLPRGKDILLVYSDSPIWHEYMATEVLPLVQKRAVVLNWSERQKWRRWSIAVAVFHQFGGGREFNPLVVLFRPVRLVRVFRFWSAFKDWKQGYTEPLERLRQELLSAL
jgi:hypothetical protein